MTERASRKLIVGVNDLVTTHPHVAAQWADDLNEAIGPESVKAGTNAQYWWRCSTHADHVWLASPNARIRVLRGVERISGCPVCASRQLLAGFNDLASVYPQLLPEWAWDLNEKGPQECFANTSRKLWWRCREAGHSWSATPANRVNQKQACPYCVGKRVIVGENDLQTLFPEIAAQWHPSKNEGRSPSMMAPQSHEVVWWQCPVKSAHVYDLSVSKRTGRGQGCGFCAGRRVLPGDNDLASLDPAKAARWHPTRNGGLLASDVTVGSDLRVWWQCQDDACGREWRAYVYAPLRCPGCERFSSQGERELYRLVRSLLPDEIAVEQRARSVLSDGRVELDVYVPSLRVAFEFNGVYWHGEDKGHGRNDLLRKRRLCTERGITLFIVWDDDWQDPTRRLILDRMVALKLGVGSMVERFSARSLLPGEARGAEASAFLRQTHVQGPTMLSRSFVLRSGDGSIVALLGLRRPSSGSRTGLSSGQWEIRRYASRGLVRGGFSRLLRHAETVLISEGEHLSGWVSFASNDVSDGGLYESNGFTVESEVAPDYWYAGTVTRWKRVGKQSFTKARFKSREDLDWAEGLTERELAALNCLVRVWDSGKVRWVRGVGGPKDLWDMRTPTLPVVVDS